MNDPFHQHLEKARRYCDYQERCPSDVRDKLSESGATTQEIASIIQILEAESLLDENRYAAAFARGKLKSNHWGKNKIRMALHLKKIDRDIIRQALDALDETEYLQVLQTIMDHYKVKETNLALRKMKIARYAIQKGFEPELVWRVVKSEE